MVLEQNLEQKKVLLKNLCLEEDKNNYDRKTIECLVHEIYEMGMDGQFYLLDLLIASCAEIINLNGLDRMLFELLSNSLYTSISCAVEKYFSCGIVPLKSEYNIDYLELQKLLVAKDFQAADFVTQKKLCELSQKCNQHHRSWLYFSDIPALPSADLLILDKLWVVYSYGLFGISVQRRIWLDNHSDWDILWNKIGWINNNQACRYPYEFVWSMEAPKGHLPLFNQLRGVQVLLALFNHPVWNY